MTSNQFLLIQVILFLFLALFLRPYLHFYLIFLHKNIKYLEFYLLLAEGLGVARGKKFEEKNFVFLAYNTPRPPISVLKKISSQSVQPFGRL